MIRSGCVPGCRCRGRGDFLDDAAPVGDEQSAGLRASLRSERMDVPLNVRLTRTIRHELERAAADLGAPSLNWLINRLLADSLEVRSR